MTGVRELGQRVLNWEWPTVALHRIPPGANAAHTLVITLDHLQRCVVRFGSRHRWRVWRRWSFTQRFEQSLVPPKTADGFQFDRLPAGADFPATPSMLDQKVRRRMHIERRHEIVRMPTELHRDPVF